MDFQTETIRDYDHGEFMSPRRTEEVETGSVFSVVQIVQANSPYKFWRCPLKTTLKVRPM